MPSAASMPSRRQRGGLQNCGTLPDTRREPGYFTVPMRGALRLTQTVYFCSTLLSGLLYPLDEYVLGTGPKRAPAQLGQLFSSTYDRKKVVAGKLAHFAGEACSTIG